MDQRTVHKRAQDAFAVLLADVSPETLGAASPCAGWDAGAVIEHVIAGNELVQRRAGREPRPRPADAVAAHRQAAEGAHDVFSAPDGLTRVYDTSAGPMPGTVFISLRTIDALTHGWDLAVATGHPTDLDEELAIYALGVAQELMAPRFRGPGRAFGEEQPCPEGRGAADRLAAFLGRPVP